MRGAAFAVTTGVTEAVAEARSLGLPVLASASNPAGVTTARAAGAAAVRLFPAAAGSPGDLRGLRDVFPDVPFVPVGGVNVAAAGAFLAVGALAVGIGGPLAGFTTRTGAHARLPERVAAFLALADQVRQPRA